MAFIIQCRYVAGGADSRMAVRATHIRYMADALDRTVAGGALFDDDGQATGMFIVLDVEGRGEAERFMADEPYNRAGLFLSVDITAARVMTPEPVPGFLMQELERQIASDAERLRGASVG